MKCDSIFWIFSILSVLIKPSLQCFRNYVPDANDVEKDIDQFGTSPRDDSLQCECGVKNSAGTADEYPWAVLIKRLKSHKTCGGSIINDLIVITSISCVVDIKDLTVKDNLLQRTLIDITNIEVHRKLPSGTLESLKIQKIECHPRAIPTVVINRNLLDIVDVCTIQLQERLTFSTSSKISPICLPKAEGLDLTGYKSKLLRWKPSTGSEEILAEKNSWIFSYTKCGKSNRIFCIQYGTPVETVENNNGGSPVMVALKSGRFIQAGISSWNSLGNRHTSKFISTPVEIVSNLGNTEIASFINYQSEKAKAKWCKEKPSDLDLPKKPSGFPKLRTYYKNPWEGITSKNRQITKDCTCGRRKSLTQGAQGRIVRGDAAAAHEYPWQVQLITKVGTDPEQGCGGSLINSKMVLTAAHCAAKGSPQNVAEVSGIKVRLGRHGGFSDKGSDMIEVGVERVFVHPEYEYFHDRNRIQNDIAILELNKSLVISSMKDVSTVCLPMTDEITQAKIFGLEATIVGWGLTNPESKTSLPDVLQELQIPVRSVDDCLNVGRRLHFSVPSGIVCAGNMNYKEQYKDPSHGDSGGPLMVQLDKIDPSLKNSMVQIGIVSAGTYDYSLDHQAAVWYTSVADYLPFIDFLSYRAGAEWCSR